MDFHPLPDRKHSIRPKIFTFHLHVYQIQEPLPFAFLFLYSSITYNNQILICLGKDERMNQMDLPPLV